MAQMLGFEITNYTLEVDGSAIRLKLYNGVALVFDYPSNESAECEYDSSNGTVRLKIGNVEYLKLDASNVSIQADGVTKTITGHRDYIDAVIATYAGSTTLQYQKTETEAKALYDNGLIVPGADYMITLDNGDIVFCRGLASGTFGKVRDYFQQLTGEVLNIHGIFNGSGFTYKASDSSAEIDSTSRFNTVTTHFSLVGYEGYGNHTISISGNQTLEVIDGGFEGQEIKIYVTGGNGNNIGVPDSGNIIIPEGQIYLYDDNAMFVHLKKRGSNWYKLYAFL